jgi:predicted DNA-binding transcriptional regulator YafY
VKRTERLIALGEYLRGRRTGVTAEAMAAHFGVTVRTMYRDLDASARPTCPSAPRAGSGEGTRSTAGT